MSRFSPQNNARTDERVSCAANGRGKCALSSESSARHHGRCIKKRFPSYVVVVNVLSRALKEAARAGNGNGLIHDPFAEAEILVDPFVGLLVLASDLVRLEAVDAVSLAQAPVIL